MCIMKLSNSLSYSINNPTVKEKKASKMSKRQMEAKNVINVIYFNNNLYLKEKEFFSFL